MRTNLLSIVSLLTCAACGDPGPPTGDGDPDALAPDVGADARPDAGPTTAERQAAAAATATSNSSCTAIEPFYWEIGDGDGVLGSGTAVAQGATTDLGPDTTMNIASASKWLYATYYVQRTSGALTAEDIKFFNFWSGYTNFSGCDQDVTVQGCLDQPGTIGGTQGDLKPGTENKFLYSGGHMQKHAALHGLGALDNAALAAELRTQLGDDVALSYTQPQLAGGVNTSATQYAKVLRKILRGELLMRDVLGTHPVCVDPTTCDLAIGTPSPAGEDFHYSLGHWVEDDPEDGDGAFSSAGAFGFYPWIDATKTLYGILARRDVNNAGFESLGCGRLIRKAWVTAVVQ